MVVDRARGYQAIAASLAALQPMFVRLSRASLVGSALILAAGFAHAQEEGVRSLWFFDGSFGVIEYETDLSEIHDYDQDGVRDLLIGQWEAVFAGGGAKFTILSGASGQILYTELAPTGDKFNDFARGIGAIGDQNGDSVDDFLIGTPGGNGGLGRIEVRSGADASVLSSFVGSQVGQRIGYRVAGVGDIDGDGHDDLAYLGGGTWVQSGATGATLHRFPSGTFARVDDLNFDGFADLVIGDQNDGQGGAVVAFSGASGKRLWHYESDQVDERLGKSVIGVRDLNGDGVREVLVGAPYFDGDRGRALLLDGSTGQLLQVHEGAHAKDRFGDSLADSGDLNGDGHADYAIGANHRRAGWSDAYVALVDGTTHERLALIRGSKSGNFASDLAAPGDLDGDGQDDLVVSSPTWGHASAFGYNRVLEASRDGLASGLGEQTDLRINFGPAEASRHYAILASRSGLGPTRINGFEIPLSDDEVFQATLSGLPLPGAVDVYGRLDAHGRARGQIVGSPSLAQHAGAQVHLCAISFDRFGAGFVGRATSTPLTLSILP